MKIRKERGFKNIAFLVSPTVREQQVSGPQKPQKAVSSQSPQHIKEKVTPTPLPDRKVRVSGKLF